MSLSLGDISVKTAFVDLQSMSPLLVWPRKFGRNFFSPQVPCSCGESYKIDCLRMTTWSRLCFPFPFLLVLLVCLRGCSVYFFGLSICTGSLVLFWRSFLKIFEFFLGNPEFFFQDVSASTFRQQVLMLWLFVVVFVFWHVWSMRNQITFESPFIMVTETILSIVGSFLLMN